MPYGITDGITPCFCCCWIHIPKPRGSPVIERPMNIVVSEMPDLRNRYDRASIGHLDIDASRGAAHVSGIALGQSHIISIPDAK